MFTPGPRTTSTPCLRASSPIAAPTRRTRSGRTSTRAPRPWENMLPDDFRQCQVVSVPLLLTQTVRTVGKYKRLDAACTQCVRTPMRCAGQHPRFFFERHPHGLPRACPTTETLYPRMNTRREARTLSRGGGAVAPWRRLRHEGCRSVRKITLRSHEAHGNTQMRG